MKRKENIAAVSAVLVSLLLVMTMLVGCGGNKAPEETPGPAAETEPVSRPEPEETPAAETDPGRQDGERFEEIVILEGNEETVGYEHVRDEGIGFELDYEYDMLERRIEPERELFVSPYDDPEDPSNYLELCRVPEKLDDAAASVYALLRNDYDLVVSENTTLDRAGECIRIDASGGRGAAGSDSMQTVYIIPAADGSLIAAAHYTVESSEGFGTRFAYIMNTCAPIDR